MIAWMVYAALVGGVVAVGGLALERLVAATGRPRRFAWLAALALAVAIPLAGGWNRPAPAPVETVVTRPAATGGVVVGDVWGSIPALPVPEGMATGRIAGLAWGAGSLASLAVLASVLVLVARGRRRWKRGWVQGAEVYVSRRFGPALVGVARPKVVIPAWVVELEPGAREAIIRHEIEHARAGDHLVLLCGGLVAAAFPWSPAIWWMYRRLRAAVELDCDQRVLASGIGVADYGDVLLSAGSRSRGQWGFAPAMGQPESLLERRLKTMSEKRRKLSTGHAALLAAVAAGAVVVACDTPVPTEVREAFSEAMADDAAQGTDAERGDWVERFLGAKAFGSEPAPLLYVDGVRIRKTEDLPESARPWFEDPPSVAAVGICCSLPQGIDIARIEVLKGPAARQQYGEEAAGGVIQIFTEDRTPGVELVVAPAQLIESVVTTVEVVDGPADTIVVIGSARKKPEVKVVGLPDARGGTSIVVRKSTTQKPEPEVVGHPGPDGRVVVTSLWLSENGVKGPPRDRPVIYIDGIRVDGDAKLEELVPDAIDRIEVTKGAEAEKLFGKEAKHGVIQIFTKKESSDGPEA